MIEDKLPTQNLKGAQYPMTEEQAAEKLLSQIATETQDADVAVRLSLAVKNLRESSYWREHAATESSIARASGGGDPHPHS